MLDKILAERFIDKISEFTEYNVNIMNEKRDYHCQQGQRQDWRISRNCV